MRLTSLAVRRPACARAALGGVPPTRAQSCRSLSGGHDAEPCLRSDSGGGRGPGLAEVPWAATTWLSRPPRTVDLRVPRLPPTRTAVGRDGEKEEETGREKKERQGVCGPCHPRDGLRWWLGGNRVTWHLVLLPTAPGAADASEGALVAKVAAAHATPTRPVHRIVQTDGAPGPLARCGRFHTFVACRRQGAAAIANYAGLAFRRDSQVPPAFDASGPARRLTV